MGDGISTIRELIDTKNADPARGEPGQKGFVLYKVAENDITEILLAEKGYEQNTIPKMGEIVYLQRVPVFEVGG